MKTKLFACIIFVVAGMMLVSYLAMAPRDDVFESNVEALSRDEFGPAVPCFLNVADSYDPELYIETRKCSDCSIVKTSYVENQSTCNL